MAVPVELKGKTSREVTKLSLGRNLNSLTWEKLVRANGRLNQIKTEELEEEVADCLLDLLFESPSPFSPTLLAYLAQSLSLVGLNGEAKLVRASYLARQTILRNPPLPSSCLDQVFQAIIDALSFDSIYALPYLYETHDELMEGIIFAANQLVSIPTSSPTSLWILRFFTHPSLIVNTAVVSAELHLKVLNAVTPAIEFLSTPSALIDPFLIQLLTHLPHVLPSGKQSSKTSTKQVPPINLRNSLDSAEPDITFLVADLINRKCSSEGLSNTNQSAVRIHALLETRIGEGETTEENAIRSTFFELMVAFMDQWSASSFNQLYSTAFCIRLPEILKVVFERDESETDKLRQAFEAALSSLKIRIYNELNVTSDPTPPQDQDVSLFEIFLTSCHQNGLISYPFAITLSKDASSFPQFLSSIPVNMEEDLIQSSLRGLLNSSGNIRPLLDSLRTTIQLFCETFNLSALSQACTLILEKPDYLETIFLLEEPRVFLAPIRLFLDTIDTTRDSFGEGHAVEKYGIVAHFLLIVMSRFDLYKDSAYHLGSSEGFISSWIPSLSAVYPLSGMDSQSSQAVNDWIRDLFGEGISDELMQSTDPRILLRVAPTICKQSLAACQAGVIDMETLKEGLSYLLHDILSFTLPGVLLWLISEIGRTVISPTQSALCDILKLFIFADTLPVTILELISPSLDSLASKLGSLPTSPMEASKIVTLIKPFTNHSTSVPHSPPQQTWISKLNSDLLHSIDPISSSSPNLPLSLHHSLSQYSTLSILRTIMDTLLKSTRPLPIIFDANEWIREGRLRKCGRSILSTRIQGGRFIFLESATAYLGEVGESLIGRKVGGEKEKIEMIILIWLEAFAESGRIEGVGGNRIVGLKEELVSRLGMLKKKIKKTEGGGEEIMCNLFVDGLLEGLVAKEVGKSEA